MKKLIFNPILVYILAIIVTAFLSSSISIKLYKSRIDDLPFLENELHYWDTKAKLVEEINKFMGEVRHHNVNSILVLKYAEKYEIDVRMFLTQGYIESHYGTKGLATRTNSVCNVGAWDDGTITHRYKHPNESIEPYFKLLATNYLVNKTEQDLLKNFVDKNGNRYASYQFYEQELKIIWDKIDKTTKIDSLLQVYRYYKLELHR